MVRRARTFTAAGYGLFCMACGRELLRDPKPWGYGMSDGQPLFSYTCPEYRWWKPFVTQHTQGYR